MALIRTALTDLLTPLDAASAADWRRQAAGTVQRLIGADGCAIMLGVPGEPSGIGVGQWEGSQPVIDIWTRKYQGRSPLDVRRHALGVSCWTRSGLTSGSAFLRSVYYNEWCRPSGNLDSAGVSAPADGGPGAEAILFVTASSTERFEAGGREEQLLALLQPAFAAGIAMLALARSWHDALGSALDLAGSPLAIARPDGELVHVTPSLLAMVASDPAGASLLAGAQALAHKVGGLLRRSTDDPLPVPTSTVELRGTRYQLRATLVQASRVSAVPLVLVSVSAPEEAAPTARTLHARFRLTNRQAEVTLLLAAGKRDRDIARTLGISHGTARRHVEHVLGKLGIHSRAAVAGRIRA
jgi:DNA-binding CsgD family transcriptional regulator